MKYIIHESKYNWETRQTNKKTYEVTAEALKELVEYREEDPHGVDYNTVKLIKMTETEMHFFLERQRHSYY